MIVDQKTSKNIVGAYLLEGTIDGAQLGLSVKPNKARRIFAKMYLGWEWVDLKELKLLNKKE